MKQFVQQISNLEEHIQNLNSAFEGIKKQIQTLPELIKKESLSKSHSKDKPKTPQTEVSENDAENYVMNLDEYTDLEITSNQKTQIFNIKNFYDYFNVLDNLDIDSNFSLIQRLSRDEGVFNSSTKNQKIVFSFVNKLIDKISDQEKGSKRSLDSKKEKVLKPKTIQNIKQKSLQNVQKQPKKSSFEEIRQYYQDHKFEQLDKNLNKDDWKLLHAIVDFDHKYEDKTLPEIAIINSYENLSQFCFNYRQQDFKQNILEYCKNGNIEGVYYSIQKKQNINEKDYYGQTGLILACRKGYDEIVDLLAKNKADVNLKSNLGQSGFMQACRYGHTKVIDVLLKYKVDCSTKDKYGKTGFIYACVKGYMDIIKKLIEHKIEYGLKDNYQKTGFDYMSAENIQNLKKFAKEKKIKLDFQNKN